MAPYIDAHRDHFGEGDPPAGRYGKVFKRLEAKHGPPETLRRWRICLAVKGDFATPEELASKWGRYGDAPTTGPELIDGIPTPAFLALTAPRRVS